MTRAAPVVLFAAAALAVATARPARSDPPYHAAAPAAVQVPYYGAVYGQPGGFSAADAKRVVELLESIDKRLAVLETKAGPVAAKAPDPAAVARARCAGCHVPKSAEAKGGGFILFADDKAGALKPLSARERARVREAVEGGTMPPNGKLSPAERSAFTQ